MRRLLGQIVFILLIPLLPATVGVFTFPLKEARQSLQKEGEIRLAEALALQPLWIDARSQSEFAAGHIPEAILLNEDDWDAQLGVLLERWDFEQPLVVYCSSQTCDASHKVADRLKADLGFESIYVLQGGWETWQNR